MSISINIHTARDDVRSFLLAVEHAIIPGTLSEIAATTRLSVVSLLTFAKGDQNALSNYDIALIHLLYAPSKATSTNASSQPTR